MKGVSRFSVIGSAILAIAAAEFGARVLGPREALPEPAEVDLSEYFSEAEMRRGRRYARPQLALGLARTALRAGALSAIVMRGRDRAPRTQGTWIDGPAGGALAGAAMATASTALGWPLAAVARRRARAVGLVTQSWRGWTVDVVKATAVESALAGVVSGAIVDLSKRHPRGWWLRAAAGSVGFGTLLGALAPVVLDPIFNDFTPLPEGQTRTDVLDLADAAGVRVGEVYSVDASRRTTAANAYVTGLGPTKRVVLFDTLLDRYSRDEVRAVVAHELAHVHHRDVLRSVLYSAIVAAPLSLATQRLGWALSPQRDGSRQLPPLALATAILGVPTALTANRLSRAVERRADAFAISLSGAPEAFVSFERAIALQNVADLDPPVWVTRLLATHPSTAERIGAAVASATPESRRTPAGS